ncbi:MAG: glutamate--tRNA ligase, partial [Coriobacteriia bacterium]|nr:glutamate--tRNA ligase [Coriobacteriia bacterium]
GDVVDKARFLFEGEHVTMDETSVAKNLAKDGALAVLDAAIAALEALPADAWEPQAIDGALEPLAEQLGIGKRKLFQPIRVAECGNQVSPPLGESMALLGRDVAIARLRNARPLAQVSEA